MQHFINLINFLLHIFKCMWHIVAYCGFRSRKNLRYIVFFLLYIVSLHVYTIFVNRYGFGHYNLYGHWQYLQNFSPEYSEMKAYSKVKKSDHFRRQIVCLASKFVPCLSFNYN